MVHHDSDTLTNKDIASYIQVSGHNIFVARSTYCNTLRLVIVFMASEIATAPSSPMELLKRL